MSKRFLSVVFACVALGFTISANSAEEEKTAEKKFDAKCIVSGAPAKEASFVDYRGKKLYFCCENCPKAYKADPDKFLAKANHQLLYTKQITEVACPLTGKPINEEKTLDIEGVKVGFCCGNCLAKAQKADDRAIRLVFAKFDKGFTLQTDCPVSGKPIVADQKVSFEGQSVYFCCPNCPDAFKAEPEKFTDKVPQLVEQANAKKNNKSKLKGKKDKDS